MEGWAKKYAKILLRFGYEVHCKMPGEDEFHKLVIHKLAGRKIGGFSKVTL